MCALKIPLLKLTVSKYENPYGMYLYIVKEYR